MSHLVMRLGDLLHLHPFAHRPAVPKATLKKQSQKTTGAAATVVEPHPATVPDDLAYFSLSVEHKVKDRRADLDRLGLIGLGDSEL